MLPIAVNVWGLWYAAGSHLSVCNAVPAYLHSATCMLDQRSHAPVLHDNQLAEPACECVLRQCVRDAVIQDNPQGTRRARGHTRPVLAPKGIPFSAVNEDTKQGSQHEKENENCKGNWGLHHRRIHSYLSAVKRIFLCCQPMTASRRGRHTCDPRCLPGCSANPKNASAVPCRGPATMAAAGRWRVSA